MALWHDRRGRLSFLRAGTLIALTLPALALLYFALAHDLGPRPFTEAIHEAGLWTIRFLMVVLLITPMRRIAHYPLLVDVRRMIGVGVFCYAALHFTLYVADQSFNLAKVASEIALRIYLTIGFGALLGLAALAATSNDWMVRRLGGARWRALHQIVYAIGVLACIHYFMQSKLDVFEPTVVAGLFVWLMLYRILHFALPRKDEFPVWVIGALGIVAGLLTFMGEAIGFWIAFHAPPLVVLAADFGLRAGIRPGWYVLGAGLIVTAIDIWRSWGTPRLQLAASSRAGRTPN